MSAVMGWDYPPGCSGPPDEDGAPLSDFASQGYNYADGEWTKTVCVTRHVAARDHKDGRVRRGDTYTRTTVRVIEDGGRRSYHRHIKRIIKRKEVSDGT